MGQLFHHSWLAPGKSPRSCESDGRKLLLRDRELWRSFEREPYLLSDPVAATIPQFHGIGRLQGADKTRPAGPSLAGEGIRLCGPRLRTMESTAPLSRRNRAIKIF